MSDDEGVMGGFQETARTLPARGLLRSPKASGGKEGRGKAGKMERRRLEGRENVVRRGKVKEARE